MKTFVIMSSGVSHYSNGDDVRQAPFILARIDAESASDAASKYVSEAKYVGEFIVVEGNVYSSVPVVVS